MKNKKRMIATVLFMIMAILSFGRTVTAGEVQTYGPVFEGNPYDEVIPSEYIDNYAEPTPMGVPLPDPDEWGTEKPVFLYTHPEKWESLYYLEGTDRYIAKIGNIYLEVSLMGHMGPVWAYTSVSEGILYGRTAHCFLFLDDDGCVFAQEEGCKHVDSIAVYGSRYSFAQLPELEKYMWQAHRIDLDVMSRVYLNSWYDISDYEVEYSGINFRFPDYNNYKFVRVTNPTWYQIDGRAFFVQDIPSVYSQEAVFIAYGDRSLLTVKYNGEFLRADSRGVFYTRDDVDYFKSYYSIWVGNREIIGEIPASWVDECEVDLPCDYNSDELSVSSILRAEPLF